MRTHACMHACVEQVELPKTSQQLWQLLSDVFGPQLCWSLCVMSHLFSQAGRRQGWTASISGWLAGWLHPPLSVHLCLSLIIFAFEMSQM